MDRSQPNDLAIEELRLLRHEVRRTRSLETLRDQFDRLHAIRRKRVEDFDIQVIAADLHHEIIERARYLRGDTPAPPRPREDYRALLEDSSAGKTEVKASEPVVRKSASEDKTDAAVIPPEVPRIDTKSWRMAIGLAVFLTALVLAGFFYLIQTARKLNFNPEEAAETAAKKPKLEEASASPAVSMKPALRLYTDLVPGVVTVDEMPPQSLTDGELLLDNLRPGKHVLKVAGRSGVASFSFEVADKSAPTVIGVPTATNAMAVLVSVQDGVGRVATNAEHSTVIMDGKPAGEIGAEGLTLADLGKTDHDLQVIQNHDRQRFVLTYTPAPILTVYVKSDPNAGVLTIRTGQDDAEIYIDSALYRRRTEHGQIRILLRVGKHRITAHKDGFADPPAEIVDIKKAEETAVRLLLDAPSDVATLQVKGAAPGTSIYIDKDFATLVGPDGAARIPNIKSGEHTIEMHHDQAVSKKITRIFRSGEAVVFSGADVTLDKVAADKPLPVQPTPVAGPAVDPNTPTANRDSSNGVAIDGERVQRGGGFVPYHTPRVSGHYSFEAQGRVGGFLKRGKLQWYAGYQDSRNYVLFSLDGKRASVREVRDGKNIEWGRIPFSVDSAQWVQVDLSVRSNLIDARVKTAAGMWNEIGSVSTSARDFTQGRMGLFVPGDDEVAIAHFRFSNR